MFNDTILVAVSCPDNMCSITTSLRNSGLRVIIATDGDEAVSRAISEHPGVMIVGSELPKKDGYMVCQFLKKSPQTSSIRILMLHPQESDMVCRGFDTDCGPDGHMHKPVDDTRLLEVVSKLI